MNEHALIRGNEPLMNFFLEARLAQDPKDRLHYLDNAIEATVNPNTRGKLVQKLYTDTLKKASFDYGKIGASRGSLGKYVHYEKLMTSYDCLMALSEGKPSASLVAFKQLHDILMEARTDFEMGYKFNIELIQLTYKTLVLSMHQLLDGAICETVDVLRETVQIETYRGQRPSHTDIVLSNVNAFIKAYNNGEWNKMIGAFKTNKQALIGEIVTAVTTSPVGIPLAVVGSIIAVLLAIRGLIYFYYNSKTRLRDYASNEAELLRINMEMERSDEPGIEKRKKFLEQLERLAGISRANSQTAEVATKKDLDEANKTLYNPGSFTDDSDFELI